MCVYIYIYIYIGTVVDEAPAVILLLVQADDQSDAGVAEDRHVILGRCT